MTPRSRIARLVLLGILLMLAGCGKDKPTGPKTIQPNELLNDRAQAALDTARTVVQTTSQIMLPNGLTVRAYLGLIGSRMAPQDLQEGPDLGPQDAKNYVIALMAEEAVLLTMRSNWVKPQEGPDRPAQPNGLAYVYGGKNTSSRTSSATGCCPELYGLDCSGFVAHLFEHAGVTIPSGPAAQQRQASVLTAALKNSSDYRKLYAEDLGAIDPSKMESGDIIYWNDSSGNTQHIGVVLGGAIYQSNGSPGLVGGSCSADQCAKNYGPTRGPRSILLSETITFFSQSGYTLGGVVRILAELSGHWSFALRCSDQDYDALTVELQFPPTQNSSWQISRDFVDYDGRPLRGEFAFTYVKLENTLSSTFSISGECEEGNPIRTESLSARLNRDDTGYVGTTELLRNGCAGCLAEVRLMNLERSRTVVLHGASDARRNPAMAGRGSFLR